MAELSGFEVLALVKEIGSALLGTYVNNIYSLGEAQIIRFRKTGGDDIWLMVSPTHGMWVSEKISERAETTEFTSRLRGELERAKFAAASQSDLDRVFELRLGEGDSARTLILELMPPGNIIVTGPDGKVLLVKEEVHSPRRRLTRGGPYVGPEQRRLTPLLVRAEDVKQMVEAEKTVGKAIGKHVSIPRKYVTEVLHRLSLTEEASSSRLRGIESEVVDVLHGLVKEAEEAPRPCVCETQKGDDIFVIRPRAFRLKEEARSISELCDKLLLDEAVRAADSETETGREETKRRELEVTISRLKSEELANLAEASRVRSSAARAAGTPSLSEARTVLSEAGLRTRKELSSPAAVASVLYDRAKELEEKAAAVQEAAKRLVKRVPKEAGGRRKVTRKLSRQRREWYEKFRWFHTSEGKLAIGGRDAHSNSTLIRRHMQSEDTVYHADVFGSPFFILKKGRDQSEAEVREVAQATVAFSSAWKTGLGSADAYWIDPEQVNLAAPSGEYLARGSFAIQGKKNFVARNMVEVAVGVDASGKVVAGPEAALRIVSESYVVIRPHREKGSETAKKILKELRGIAGSNPESLSIDDVLRALPAGGGKVIRKVGPNR